MSDRHYLKIFKGLRFYLGVGIARPKTIFWHKEPGFRTDQLIGLVRIFDRASRLYMYTIYIGRLAIQFGRF